MTRYAAPMTRLIDELRKLPGVGTRTAQRFAFHILRSSDSDAAALADSIRALKAALRLCSICNNITDVDPCLYCTSPTVEGEATARYLADEAHRQFPTLAITRIATGVPAGSDIEYADEVTMTRALENRRAL